MCVQSVTEPRERGRKKTECFNNGWALDTHLFFFLPSLLSFLREKSTLLSKLAIYKREERGVSRAFLLGLKKGGFIIAGFGMWVGVAVAPPSHLVQVGVHAA